MKPFSVKVLILAAFLVAAIAGQGLAEPAGVLFGFKFTRDHYVLDGETKKSSIGIVNAVKTLTIKKDHIWLYMTQEYTGHITGRHQPNFGGDVRMVWKGEGRFEGLFPWIKLGWINDISERGHYFSEGLTVGAGALLHTGSGFNVAFEYIGRGVDGDVESVWSVGVLIDDFWQHMKDIP